MFDKYMICEDGFRNVEKDGEVIGFQLQVRITYYRGLGLSMVEGFEVSVDGEEFPRQAIRFELRGKSWTLDELEREYVERWEFGEKATLLVLKPGGLAPGSHEVKASQQLRVSYMPFPIRGGTTARLELAA